MRLLWMLWIVVVWPLGSPATVQQQRYAVIDVPGNVVNAI